MTLDEAIAHCEEVMMDNIEKTKDRNASDPVAHNCFECADNHRQLAEWLKELKRHREAWKKIKDEYIWQANDTVTVGDYKTYIYTGEIDKIIDKALKEVEQH